eukprot:CAMPEP_0115104462 /NCGR_PEP_ID=MMETSP0227-20121206/35333_1 /TAXON_ID=89957 /ORGANISM="Polarella glacialis, Strain CCMP 1383" /LENGTH=38 /DNA_ID= /DNA_START= /DNA_END= /DNA_ORIENTATION=
MRAGGGSPTRSGPVAYLLNLLEKIWAVVKLFFLSIAFP